MKYIIIIYIKMPFGQHARKSSNILAPSPPLIFHCVCFCLKLDVCMCVDNIEDCSRCLRAVIAEVVGGKLVVLEAEEIEGREE